MKNYILILGAAVVMAGCANPSPTPTDNTATTVAVIQSTVPIAVAIEVQRDPSTVPYFRAAADVIDAAVATNANVEVIVADIQALKGNSYVELAVLGGVAIVRAYVANNPNATPANVKTVMSALSAAVRAGLPPATPDSIRGFKTRSASTSQRSAFIPFSAQPGAVSGPVRVWNNLQAPFRATGTNFFQAKELTLDLSTTYSAVGGANFGQLWTSKFKTGVWGVNVASTYWITENFGAGIEAGILNYNNPSSLVIDYTATTATARLPIGRFAPYGLASMGRNFGSGAYYTQAGAGLAVALTPRVRIFGDGRFTWQQEQAQNGLLIRAGLEFAF